MSEALVYLEKCLQGAKEIAMAKTVDTAGHELKKRQPFNELKRLLDGFHAGRRDERWVVMLGLRGVGKSTLVQQGYRHLTETLGVDPKDVLCFSMSDATDQLNIGLASIVAAYEESRLARLTVGAPVYLLVDEVHHDERWAAAAKEIYERAPNVFLLVTGSSALALQSDGNLEADKARRVNWLRVAPLKFSETLLLNDGVDYTDLSQPMTAALFGSASAQEVIDRLAALGDRWPSFRVHCDEFAVRKYLTQGQFPFAMGLSPAIASDKMLRTMNAVIEKDLVLLKGQRFDQGSIRKFPRLLTLLSLWEDVAVKKLCDAMTSETGGVTALTLHDMIEALRLCGLIKSIRTHGGLKVKVTRPPRYAFGSTNLKAALRWGIGSPVATPEDYGKLLEDLLIQTLETDEPWRPVNVYRREGEGEADFLLTTPLGEQIICEVGYGHKTADQVRKTMADGDVHAKYGLLIADEPPSVSPDGRIAIVPKECLLAC